MLRTLYSILLSVASGIGLGFLYKLGGYGEPMIAVWCFVVVSVICLLIVGGADLTEEGEYESSEEATNRLVTRMSWIALGFASAAIAVMRLFAADGVLAVIIAAILVIFSAAIFAGRLSEAFPQRKKYTLDQVFASHFGFEPYRLAELRYKKEAMLKLAISASAVAREAECLSRHPANSIFQMKYEEELSRYQRYFSLLESYDPDFTADIPHWTELPAYVKGWLNGEVLKTQKREARAEKKDIDDLAAAFAR
jgi:hypothetical protein